jgi:GNAT superfamily N-acetyltransferase
LGDWEISVEIVPFHEGHLPAAADLLAQRHARDRAAMPLLPARFTEIRPALAAVREVWHKPWTMGVAALGDGRMLGYLLGEAQADNLRGRHVWVHLAGHALAEDAPPALYGHLYAAAGPVWLAFGAFDHYVMMPAADAGGQDAWFSLSFGREQAHAIRPLAEPLPEPAELPGVRIRRATEDDRDVLLREMVPLLRDRLAGPPVWAAALPEYVRMSGEWFAELLDDANVYIWLALDESNDQMLGYQAYLPATPADDNLTISMSEPTVLLRLAATRPEARRRGIGRALSRVGLAGAAAAGYHLCVTDWRTTNLEAARFWPGMGFRVAVNRLVRRVDSRVAWGGGITNYE